MLLEKIIQLFVLLWFPLFLNAQMAFYQCPPCGMGCDTIQFHQAGTCPHCGMQLVLKLDKPYLQGLPLDSNVVLQELAKQVSVKEISHNLTQITDEVGARLMGSKAYQKAAKKIVRQMQAYGIKQAKLETFGPKLRSWDINSFQIEMLSPSFQRLNAFPRAYVKGTNGPIEAEVLLVPHSEDLPTYKGKMEGKIILIGNNYTPQTGVSPIALWRKKFNASELNAAAKNEDPNDRKLGYYSKRATPDAIAYKEQLYQKKEAVLRFLEEEGALAILEASSMDFGMLQVDGWGFVPAYYQTDDIKPLPSFVLANEEFGRIVRLLKAGQEIKLRLDLNAQFEQNTSRHQNVIVDLPGTDPELKDEWVILGAHLDSWHSSLGVTDNGANCALMMESMRILKKSGLKNKRSIRLILWGGHEQNFQGSRAYIKRHLGNLDGTQLKDQRNKISAYYNMDNGTGKIRGLYLMGNDSIKAPLEQILKPFPESQTLTIQYANQSDHELFDWMGVPAFQFIQDPLSYIPVTHHTNMDYREYFSMEDQAYNALLLAYLAYQTANAEQKMPRKAYHSPIPITTGKTTIRLEGYPDAKKVSVFAYFNNWNLYGTKMKKVKGGWECKLDLPKGRHLYKFIIDNDYVAPPHTKEHFKDGKGHGGLAELIVK